MNFSPKFRVFVSWNTKKKLRQKPVKYSTDGVSTKSFSFHLSEWTFSNENVISLFPRGWGDWIEKLSLFSWTLIVSCDINLLDCYQNAIQLKELSQSILSENDELQLLYQHLIFSLALSSRREKLSFFGKWEKLPPLLSTISETSNNISQRHATQKWIFPHIQTTSIILFLNLHSIVFVSLSLPPPTKSKATVGSIQPQTKISARGQRFRCLGGHSTTTHNEFDRK